MNMERIGILIGVLEYIEQNLTECIKTEDIANHLFCSKSCLEKLFRYLNGYSIRDYIIRRRMSLAAKALAASPGRSILDIGIEYGYGSNEAFTRAFCSVWQVSPSEFRKNPSAYELFPALRIDRELMEEKTMEKRKKFDISELYDCIQARKGCYLILGDIRSLIPINEISAKAGNLAIITALQRMEAAAGADDIVFRIGGDEFVILTASRDEEYAKALYEKIQAHNGEAIVWEGKEIPLSLYLKALRYEGARPLRYAEFFTMLQRELNETKQAQDI